jgi:hypothetical protein
VAALIRSCPRCGLDHEARFAGPCDACRAELRRIYGDRAQLRRLAMSHMPAWMSFSTWLVEPHPQLNGDTPWDFVLAGFTDQVAELIAVMRLTDRQELPA